MITLITAIPGSGKTLFVLQTLHEMATKENRQVYYHGIPLTDEGKKVLGWIELEDPQSWPTLPAEAIIVIDEAQYVFPVRRSGTVIPASVDKFATHRHLGLDIFLITQGPQLIDSFIRPLVGRHYHLIRLFGMAKSKLLRWESCQQNPNARQAKADCLDKRNFVFPRKVYTWYKSAEAHTMKVSIPKKVWILLGIVWTTIFLIGYFYWSMSEESAQAKAKPSQSGPIVTAQAAPMAVQSQGAKAEPLTPQQYVSQRLPRMPGFPDSAPVYDDLAKPRTFPRAAACVASVKRCQCYTQQGTRIDDLPEITCREMVAKSWFDPYRSEHEAAPREAEQGGQPRELVTAPPPPSMQIATMGSAQQQRMQFEPTQSGFGRPPTK